MTEDDVRVPTTHAYDRVVEDYVRRTRDVPADFAAFRAEFVDRVPVGGRIADLGCGPGRDAALFRAAGLGVVGVDASHRMAERTLAAGIPVARGDIRRAPLRDGSLDGVWSAAALLHVPRDDVASTLRGWGRPLRSGGVLGLSTALGDGEGWEDWPRDPSAPHTTRGLRRWFVRHRPAALVELLIAAGFVVHVTRESASHRRWLQVLASRAGA